MPLTKEGCYGLAGGAPGRRVSVFHVKLTDCAARAVDTFQNTKSQTSHPTICFAGDQGRLTVPGCDGDLARRVFSFGLTRVVRHIPHGSFDCVRQSATRDAGGQLSHVGPVQQRLTVRATDASYQKAYQNMAQAEEETRKRAAIVIKDGGRGQKRRVTVRPPGPALVSLARPRPAGQAPLGGTQRRRPSAQGVRSARAGVGGLETEKRPIRERLVHLLGVRPYRREDLLLRLQQDGLMDGEKEELDQLLLEVGQLNSRDQTLVLRDQLYSELQKDWPGYTPLDQTLLKRHLVRRMFRPYRRRLSVPGAQVSPLRDTPNSSPARHAHRPRLVEEHPPGHAPAHKKPRVSRVSAGNGGVAVATGDPVATDTAPPLWKHPARRTAAGGDVAVTTEDVKRNKKNSRRGESLDPRRLSDSLQAVRLQGGGREEEAAEAEAEAEEEVVVSERLQPSFSWSTPRPRESHNRLPQPGPAPARLPQKEAPPPARLPQHGPHTREEGPPPPAESPQPRGPKTERRLKKRGRSRLGEQEKVRSGDEERTGGSNPGELKTKGTSECKDTSGACRDSGALRDAGPMRDYLSAYTVILDQQQRLRYKQDFNQEYQEYRGLHARIDDLTRQFMRLNTQLRQRSRGSREHKTIRNQILQQYRTIKKFNPNYNQDRIRCEYLHDKLAHIKKLISVYDQTASRSEQSQTHQVPASGD